MPKKRKVIPQRAPSKRHIAEWQRQKKLQRYAFVLGVLVIASIMAIMGYGYYDSKVKPARQEQQRLEQAALRVNDKVFSNGYLLKLLIAYGQGMKSSGSSLSINFFGKLVESLQEFEMLTQEAPRIDIAVSDEEIDKDIRTKLGFTPGDTKKTEADFQKTYEVFLERTGLTDEDNRYLTKALLLQAKVMDEFIGKSVPTEEMQVQVERILLRTEEEANKVVQQLQSGVPFATLVKDLSQDTASKDKDGNTGWITKKEISGVWDEIAFKLRKGEVSQPFFDNDISVKGGYWVVKVTDKQEDKVKAEGILLRTEREANQVKARLEQGEDFSALAKELSVDIFSQDSGGDLGQIARGSFGAEFDKVVFDLEPGQLGGPVFDDTRYAQGGYWVLKALEEPQMRSLDKDRLDQRKSVAYQKWMDEKRQEYRLENNLDDETRNWLLVTASNTINFGKKAAASGTR